MMENLNVPLRMSDVDISDTMPVSSTLSEASTAKHLLKGMQPYRENPSKDRRKRFCVSNIYGDNRVPSGHDVHNYQFWAITPQNNCQSKMLCSRTGHKLISFRSFMRKWEKIKQKHSSHFRIV